MKFLISRKKKKKMHEHRRAIPCRQQWRGHRSRQRRQGMARAGGWWREGGTTEGERLRHGGITVEGVACGSKPSDSRQPRGRGATVVIPS